MFDARTLLILIPALPLAAAILTALLGPRVLRSQSHWLAIVGIFAAFVCSVMLALEVYHRQANAHEAAAAVEAPVGVEIIPAALWTWATVDQAYTPAERTLAPSEPHTFNIDITLRADALTAMMLVMVTFVATLVAIYSSGYMHGDSGYWRFFTYVSLFVFSMTMLVSVSNFVLLYVFWEAVGVCSYLLIGFWYQKPEAAAAGKKAFLVNRVGDFGFALGLFLIWSVYGTLNFHDTPGVPGVLGQARLSGELGYMAGPLSSVEGQIAFAICLLLLVGACGKSAQFPLHVWLPDAMEGPTPVSALIHAATMVTAGVYMVARCIPLYVASPPAQAVVAAIGGFTALLAALIALTQFDLKRVLAYSTISQLGYMFLAMGTATAAGVTAGMFHLFTHAFFKALLFLGAGSVMHAMGGVIDMRRFSGLRRIMPTTYVTFFIGSLALAGMFPLSGFFSKDAVIAAVWDKAQALEHDGGPATLYYVLVVSALVTALLTAFYTFRAFFMTFHGQERVPEEAGHHAHESPPNMTGPLVALAVLAAIVGGALHWTGKFDEFLHHTPSLAMFETAAEHGAGEAEHHGGHGWIVIASIVIALVGIGGAAFLYLGDQREIRAISQAMQLRGNPRWAGLSPYQFSYRKFYFDEIYDWLLVRPFQGLAKLSYWIDRHVIDGLVNLVGRVPPALGSVMRSLQTGLVQFYALAMVVGVLILLMARLWAAN